MTDFSNNNKTDWVEIAKSLGLIWFAEKIFEALKWLVESRGITQLELDAIWAFTHKRSVQTIRMSTATFSGTAGAGSIAIPAYGIVIDIATLLEAMQKACLSVGASLAYQSGGDVDDIELQDYVDILTLWAGAPDAIQCTEAKEVILSGQLAYGAGKIAGKLGGKAVAKVFGKTAGGIASFASGAIGSQIGAKLAVKATAKTAAAGSATAFWGVGTIFGMVLNSGVNIWLLADITHHAEVFYKAKFNIEPPPEGYLAKLNKQ